MPADAEGIQNTGSQVRPLAGGGLSESHVIAHRADGFGVHGRSVAARGKAEGLETTTQRRGVLVCVSTRRRNWLVLVQSPGQT